jgi:hypothetical protein
MALPVVVEPIFEVMKARREVAHHAVSIACRDELSPETCLRFIPQPRAACHGETAVDERDAIETGEVYPQSFRSLRFADVRVRAPVFDERRPNQESSEGLVRFGITQAFVPLSEERGLSLGEPRGIATRSEGE